MANCGNVVKVCERRFLLYKNNKINTAITPQKIGTENMYNCILAVQVMCVAIIHGEKL